MKRDMAKLFDDPEFCIPGKTCVGLVSQLFMSSTCDWSMTYGFLPLLDDHTTDVLGACYSSNKPQASVMATCTNASSFFHESSSRDSVWSPAPNVPLYTRTYYSDLSCKSEPTRSFSYGVGTCFGSPDSEPANVFWCDATHAHPLTNTKPALINHNVPELPSNSDYCTSTSPPSTSSPGHNVPVQWGEPCDPHFSINRHYVKDNLSGAPTCPAPQPSQSGDSHYTFGKGLPRTCYLDGALNTWMTLDDKSITITNGLGCNTGAVYSTTTQTFGCSWESPDERYVSFNAAGSLR